MSTHHYPRLAWLAACLFCLAFAGLAPAAPASQTDAAQADSVQAAASSPDPVLLISIDGFRADYLEREQSPTLNSMAASGVRAKWMQPAFPTLTFPNHYTLVTGLYPDHHGIIGNSMYDAKLGKFSLSRTKAMQDPRWWNEAEPIWVTASKQGLTTATEFWPGSGTAIHGRYPDYWRPFDGRVTGRQRVNQIVAWLDLPADQRPDFLTLYFDKVDHNAHGHGPNTPQVNAAIRKVDADLGYLVTALRARGLYEHMNIIVVSDHGFASIPKDNTVLIDKIIDLDHVHIVSMGVVAGFNLKPEHADVVADKLLQEHPHMRCWRKGHFPERLHYGHNARVPDITCLADIHWSISDSAWLKKHNGQVLVGNHGYDNADPLMHAIFIAHGPAFQQGVTLDGFPNVDVYSLLAHLLGIQPRPNDGSLKPFLPVLHDTITAGGSTP